ncbi:acetolactate synthase small subunit [Dermacoccus nishinomiyaensis]|uniref:acetolactate synthase small subunit n=1 Tax=Dermacoccus nishinomiyaensis TaxID=1274 RepID=UPI0013F44897|nr:acetolactate synthase small subunit [Dermacoccus nishinomiyaensis]MCG7429308.1 acetolactate synthase small subunit [Dermacoccus nishinomiyaensis]NHC32832.1 acetolactate synthase small subunit [Dermacoccus nishinomiyaensis]
MTTNRHILSVLVENKSGVLARISGLISRRGFNIHSLAVGETEDPHVSRMTVTVDADDVALEQVVKQLNKLVEVLKVVELDHASAIERQLVLFKVKADAATRSQIIDLVTMFRANIIDVTNESVVIEATGTLAKLEALLTTLEPFGVRELVQSGVVGLGRGSKAISARDKKKN